MTLFPSGTLYPSPSLYTSGDDDGDFNVVELEYPQVLTTDPAGLDVPDLLSDLPPFEQESLQIANVLGVIANELARVEQARRNLLANWFPATSVSLLHFYERQLGLPPDSPALSTAQRQQAVLTLMQSLKSSGSGSDWEATVTKLVGTSWSYEEHDPADATSPPAYTILVRIPYVPPAGVVQHLHLADSGTGGTLAAGTYYYAVTGVTGYGETTATPIQSITVAAGHEIGLTWDALPNALTYNVYRGPGIANLRLMDSTATNSYTDAGADTPAGNAPPTTDASGSPQASVADKLLRATTPAHVQIVTGFSAGFLVGISEIGVSAL